MIAAEICPLLGLRWNYGSIRALTRVRHNFTLWSDHHDLSLAFMTRLEGELAKVFYLGESDSLLRMPKGTVLVVEDNPMARICAVIVVEDAGYCAIIAVDAQEALDALAEHPRISALFTDVEMPGSMDGFELAAEARRLRPDLGILIASGKAEPRLEDLPERAVFVSKPYAVPVVTLALAALLAEVM
jgi:two-component system, response regulator PdtaR